MRIVRVTRAYPPVWDGAANHVVGLSTQQARAGHRVWVLQPHLPDGSGEETMPTRLLVRLPGALRRGVYRRKVAITAFHLRAFLLERQIHRRHGVEVVHVHGDALDAFLQTPPAHLFGAPLVQTVHAGLSRRWLYRRTAPRLLRHVTRFIAVAPNVAADLVALGVSADRITVISSGIDTRRFNIPSRANGPHIVSIGRLHPAKGFPVLLAAVRLLAASGLTPPVTIVGEGAERERLKDLGADLPHVRFAGSIPHERIPDLLSTATLFVLPSVDRDGQREGTPSVLMEAMAGGLPIVTTDSGGAADLVRHRLNGLVVPQHSPAALAEALRELLQDETARGLIGERNRRKAAEKDWSVIESQVAAVYETALRQYTRRPPPLLP